MIDLKNTSSYRKVYNSKTPRITAASFLVTEDCNLLCTYCFEKHKKNNMLASTAARAVDFLYDNAIYAKESHVGVTLFGGEPTLVPDIMEVVYKTGYYNQTRYNIPFHSDIITNATIYHDRLDRVYAEYQGKLKSLRVQLSVDGKPETQDRYRKLKSGGGSSQLVLKTIPKYLNRFKDRMDDLSIHGCANKETLHLMYENFLYFREELGIWHTWFIPVCEENWSDKDVETYEEQQTLIYNYIMNRVKKENNTKEIERNAPFNRSLRFSGRPGKPCGAGSNYATITANGDIYPCHQIYYNDPNKETYIGNIIDGVDDDKRRFFLEYDSNDLTCPSDCDHGSCYRCIAVNWVKNGSPISQIRGNYCKMMKIDKKLQDKMREEIKSMGLLNSNKQQDSGGACLCNIRAQEQQNNNSACMCDGRSTNCENPYNKEEVKGDELIQKWEVGESIIYKVKKPDGTILITESPKNKQPCKCDCGKKDESEAPSAVEQINVFSAALSEILRRLVDLETSVNDIHSVFKINK